LAIIFFGRTPLRFRSRKGKKFMKITRRQFIKGAAATGVALSLPLKFGVRSANAYAISPGLQKFIDPLPPFVQASRMATPVQGVYAPGTVDYYELTGGVFRASVSSDMQRALRVNNPAATYNGTRMYGYRDTASATHVPLGAAIAVNKGTPVRMRFTNDLPAQHIIPFDATITQGLPAGTIPTQDRMAIHLHGGLVPWTSDGGPFHWFGRGANTRGQAGAAAYGASWMNWLPDETGTPTMDIYYPNNQSARLMWYHDHAIGITRINAYAGLATGYLILDLADPVDAAIGGIGEFLVFQDKVFWDPVNDPNYGLKVNSADLGGAQAGDMWYPYMYEKAIWKLQGNAKKGTPIPSAIPEMFGDTMLVNGICYPTHNVAATRLRLRTLNACNARFLNLKFVYESGATGEPQGGYLAPMPAPVDVWIIGTEGGYLKTTKQVVSGGVPVTPTALLMGPAERMDLIVDFTLCENQKILLYNDAPAPYPIGAPIFDWYPLAPGNPGAATIQNGFGPNTRTIMRFAVGAAASRFPIPDVTGANPVLATTPDLINGGLKLSATPGSNVSHNGANYNYVAGTQELTLNETFDIYGRLMQLVGTTVPLVKGTFGRAYLDPGTEKATYGTIQIWNIYNLTADTHPMHFHLFNVMVLRRRLFRVQGFSGIPVFTALGRGPDPGEEGWKETVKMWPGECTTVAVLVEPPLPGMPANRDVIVTNAANAQFTGTLPPSPRLTAQGTPGDEYVWHCHILEHEEHDMMRPLIGL
jgi:spore coat protein A, manganese oxidase